MAGEAPTPRPNATAAAIPIARVVMDGFPLSRRVFPAAPPRGPNCRSLHQARASAIPFSGAGALSHSIPRRVVKIGYTARGIAGSAVDVLAPPTRPVTAARAAAAGHGRGWAQPPGDAGEVDQPRQ